MVQDTTVEMTEWRSEMAQYVSLLQASSHTYPLLGSSLNLDLSLLRFEA